MFEKIIVKCELPLIYKEFTGVTYGVLLEITEDKLKTVLKKNKAVEVIKD